MFNFKVIRVQHYQCGNFVLLPKKNFFCLMDFELQIQNGKEKESGKSMRSWKLKQHVDKCIIKKLDPQKEIRQIIESWKLTLL